MQFRHFDGNFRKVGKTGVAAARPSAGGKRAAHFRVVAFINLAKFDAVSEHARKVFDKVAEIDSSRRREVKDNLLTVKSVFHVHKLHIKVVFFDFLVCDANGFRAHGKVFFHLFFVGVGGFP